MNFLPICYGNLSIVFITIINNTMQYTLLIVLHSINTILKHFKVITFKCIYISSIQFVIITVIYKIFYFTNFHLFINTSLEKRKDDALLCVYIEHIIFFCSRFVTSSVTLIYQLRKPLEYFNKINTLVKETVHDFPFKEDASIPQYFKESHNSINIFYLTSNFPQRLN